MLHYNMKSMASPLGLLRLTATSGALVGVELPASRKTDSPDDRGVRANPMLELAAQELEEYFLGERTSFSIPTLAAGTPFQRAIWDALVTIPYGERRSYAWLAGEVGRPRAYRAAGSANARNPLPIMVPCHRVVGAGGALSGYAGGVEAKRWLLEHEQRFLGRPYLK